MISLKIVKFYFIMSFLIYYVLSYLIMSVLLILFYFITENDLLKLCGGELIKIKEKIAQATTTLDQATEQKRKKKRK
jgi:hypothetical protein